MIAKFILIAIFSHGYGPSVNYVPMGEFATLTACQAAADAIRSAGNRVDLMGHRPARFVCASNGVKP